MAVEPIIIVSLAICFVGIVLNACEIASLVHGRRTKMPFDITIISLAASDLMLAAISFIPGILHYSLREMATLDWYRNLYTFCIYSSCLSSAIHMLFIAVQQLIAVLYPLKVSILITRKRCIKTICLLWLISCVASLPVSLKFYDYQLIFMYSPLVTACVIVVCYVIINIRMWTRKRPTASGQSSNNMSVLIYSISITAIFMICTFPYTIYTILYPQDLLNGIIPPYALYLFYFQVILDPVVYFFSHIWKKSGCRMCCNASHCCGSENVTVQEDNWLLLKEHYIYLYIPLYISSLARLFFWYVFRCTHSKQNLL